MPDVRLGVEIDNARVVDVMPIAYGASNTMDLAAIERGQRRAIVKLYMMRGSKRSELATIDVRELPVFPNRRALLRLRTSVDRAGELRVRLDVEGRLYYDERMDARPFMRRSPLATAVVVIVALLIAAGAIYALWPRPGAQAPVIEEATPETPSEPTPAGDAEVAQADEGDAEDPDAGDPGADGRPDAAAEPDQPGAGTSTTAREEAPTAAEPAAEPAEWAVYFQPDSPLLTPQARSRLVDIASRLSDYDEDTEITIVGHTALAGTERGRYDLSRERARNVRDFMQAQGWDADQTLTTRGVGGDQPVTRDPDRQQLNRRVEITVRPE
jgi:outer membrane protein OmpA-like peptidoglycan-associated protein